MNLKVKQRDVDSVILASSTPTEVGLALEKLKNAKAVVVQGFYQKW